MQRSSFRTIVELARGDGNGSDSPRVRTLPALKSKAAVRKEMKSCTAAQPPWQQ